MTEEQTTETTEQATEQIDEAPAEQQASAEEIPQEASFGIEIDEDAFRDVNGLLAGLAGLGSAAGCGKREEIEKILDNIDIFDKRLAKLEQAVYRLNSQAMQTNSRLIEAGIRRIEERLGIDAKDTDRELRDLLSIAHGAGAFTADTFREGVFTSGGTTGF